MMCYGVSNLNRYQMASWLIFGFLVGPHSRHKLQYVNIDQRSDALASNFPFTGFY